MRPTGPTIALSLLLLSGCATSSQQQRESSVAEYAESLSAGQQAIDATLDSVASFEYRAGHEAEAIAFSGAPPRRRGASDVPPASAANAAVAAEQVFAAAFTALASYTQNLARLGNEPDAEPQQVDGAALQAQATRALAQFEAASGRSIPEPVRGAGLAAIPQVAAAPAPDMKPQTLAQERDGEIQAVVNLLKAVIGGQQDEGLRGTLRTRRDSFTAQRTAFLDSIRSDPRASRLDRYRAYQMMMQSQSEDPVQGALREVVVVLDRLAAADDGLARNNADLLSTNVRQFQAAVDHLWQIQPQLTRPEPEGE